MHLRRDYGRSAEGAHVLDRPTQDRRYFVSAPVDAAVIAGSSVLVYAMFRLFPSTTTSSTVDTVGLWLVWAISYPHFVSTDFRLYATRSTRRQYPLTAMVTPAIFGLAIVVCFLSPGLFAPAFVKLYQLWSPYHFSGQTLGLTVLYSRRCATPLDRNLRRALVSFIYLTFLYSAARAEVGGRPGRFAGVVYPSLAVPSWLPDVFEVGIWASVAVLVVALVRRWRSTGAALPWIVLLPALTQCLWFATTPLPAYRNWVFFFHSLQYVFVAWNLQLRERLDVAHQRPSTRFVLVETVRWFAAIVAGGYVLFSVLPRLGAHFGRSLAFSTAVVLVAIQTHHFFVDGVIWRLRNQHVASPLSSTLADVAGRRPLPAP
jgi:hypothetical protein